MIQFVVLGSPEPQGSSKGFVSKRTGRVWITSDNRNLKSWRQGASMAALEAMSRAGKRMNQSDAVQVEVTFYFARPKSLAKKIMHKITRPDLDKLARAVGDAMTGIVYRDDSQVVDLVCRKRFGDPERTEITVRSISAKEMAA